MRYISTSDANITFTDTNGKVKIVPKNRVYTHFNGDTVTFLLIERYDSEGICIFTTMADDLQINGTSYTYEQLVSGEGIGDMFSPTGLSFEIVKQLPETGSDGKIYLVPNGENSYSEYIWIANETRYEMLGDVGDIELTNYFTKDEINSLLAEYASKEVVNQEIAARIAGDGEIKASLDTKADKSDTYTKEQVDNAIETSQNEINGKILEKEEVISRALNEIHEEKADKTEIPDVSALATKSELDEKANKSDIPDTSDFMTKAEYNPKETAIVEALTDLNENKANTADLSTVATSGSYNDLKDKPSIPEGAVADAELSDTSENPVQNKVIKSAIDSKADASALTEVRQDISKKADVCYVDFEELTGYGFVVDIELYNSWIEARRNNAIFYTSNTVAVDGLRSVPLLVVSGPEGEFFQFYMYNENGWRKAEIWRTGETEFRITTDEHIYEVDDQLNSESDKPVQNSVITQALNSKADVSSVYTKSEIDGMIGNISTILASI